MSKTFEVKTGNWHKEVVLEVTENEPYRDATMEAATVAVESFFKGDVRVDDINQPHTIDPVITVIGKEYEADSTYNTYLYAPVVIANAGHYKEARLFQQKINSHNYESTV
jgi:hypothetical protein